MNIDWSKAPEGATHYDSHFSLFCNKDGYWNSSGIWTTDPNQNGWGTRRYLSIPGKTWTGAGLPPVGTVCQVDHTVSGGKFDRAEIIAHIFAKGMECAVYRVGDQVAYASARLFWPLLNAEQIEAEEDIKATIEEIRATIFNACGAVLADEVLRALAVAGYRKQVQP